MKILDLSTVSEKCVINLCNGKELGYVCDVRFTCDEGKICALVVPRDNGILSFGKCESIIIPWDKVECIGEDAILVRVSDADCKSECDSKGKRKKHIFGF